MLFARVLPKPVIRDDRASFWASYATEKVEVGDDDNAEGEVLRGTCRGGGMKEEGMAGLGKIVVGSAFSPGAE